MHSLWFVQWDFTRRDHPGNPGGVSGSGLVIPYVQNFNKSNSNGSFQKRGAKCHFTTLNSVLAPMNSVFTPMVGVKMGCHFNNSMFFIKKYN